MNSTSCEVSVKDLCVSPKVVLNILVPGLAGLLEACQLGRVQALENPSDWVFEVSGQSAKVKDKAAPKSGD